MSKANSACRAFLVRCTPLHLLVLLIGWLHFAAFAQVQTVGKWTTQSYTMPINPIHAALLHTGNILIVAGSGNCPPSQSGCPSGAPYGPSNKSGALLLNPTNGAITQFTLSWDMFCNGMVVLPDGRAFINSGTIQYDPFYGQLTSAIFDPSSNTFTNAQNMAHGRWYPTLVTLGDGRIMTFSGFTETGATNSTVEIYTVGTGWSQPYSSPWTPDLYPRLHLLPNGTVFYSGSETVSNIFNPATTTWTQNVATTNYGGTRTYGTSVLLPLTPANNYDPEIIIMGGGSPATATTEVIDMGASNPKWTSGPSMSEARTEMNAVILPNGKVLAVGGSVNDEDTSTASLNADLYDPGTNKITSAGANAFARLYHSVALLLPDATVWFAGGNPARGTYQSSVEIYQPAYLFNSNGNAATRPTLSGAPPSITYGAPFSVQTDSSSTISSAVLVRNGTVTHAFGMDQRLVGLSLTQSGTTITLTGPPNGNIAPPGYYMLFLLNSSGVPSIASMVQVTTQPQDYSLAVTPSSQTVIAGNNLTYTTTVAPSGGFDGQVTFSASGLPTGTTASFNPASVTGSGSSTLTISTTTSAAIGSYPLTITGSGSITHTANATLVVGAAAATPTFSPAPGSYANGVTVTISDATAGATIHCTTDETTPTASSPVCTSLNLSTSTAIQAIAVASGYNNSAVASGTYVITSAANPVDYSAGFVGAGMQLNGKATLNGTRLRLTDTSTTNEAGSAFFTTPVNVQNFTTSFSFQLTNANADGMAFVIQNNGLTALGPSGGGLGYGPGSAGATPYAGMNKSVAVKFDLYSNSGEGSDSTGIYTDGASPTTPATDMTSSGVNLHSGDVFNVSLSYNGTTLTMTIKDAGLPEDTFTTSWTVNIPSVVGGSTAWVGFTGGTGGQTAIQEILTWTYDVNFAPTVTGISPATGTTKGGTAVTITGTGFQPGASVTFGGEAAGNVSVASSTMLTATTPADSSGAVNVVVANSAGQSGALNNGYTYVSLLNPDQTTLAASATTISQGTSITFTADVLASGTNSVPTGTVTFFSGTTQLGTAALNSSGIATYTTNSLVLGAYSVTASYGGDSNFAASTSAPVAVTVTAPPPVATNTTVAASGSSVTQGATVSLTATVRPVSGSGTPTGTVTFMDGSTALGSATLNSGTANYGTNSLALGVHSITANYGGDANYSGSTAAAISITITPPPQTATTTTLAASATSVAQGASVVFTATVAPVSGNGTPTGTVSFLDGTTAMGTATLNSAGVATYSTSSLPVGSNSVTATYQSNSNFAASTSSPVSVTVAVTQSQSPDFAFTANTGSVAVGVGKSGTVTLTVTPQNGFNQAVTFSCSGAANISCSFNPSSVTPNNSAATSALTLTVLSAAQLRSVPSHSGSAPLYAILAPGLVLLAGKRKRAKSAALPLALVMVLVAAALWMTSCGGSTFGGSAAAPISAPQTQTSVVTVTASTAGSNPTSQTLNISVSVSQ